MRYRRRSHISLTGRVRVSNLTLVGVKGPEVSKKLTYAQVAEMSTMTDPVAKETITRTIVQSFGGSFQGEYSTNYVDFKLAFIETCSSRTFRRLHFSAAYIQTLPSFYPFF